MTSTFHEFFKINQHNFFPSYSLCSIFHTKICCQRSWKSSSIFIFHPKFHLWISFIHEHMAKYSFTSPNIMSHVSNNIFQIFCRHQNNISKNIHPCSLVHAHLLTSSWTSILAPPSPVGKHIIHQIFFWNNDTSYNCASWINTSIDIGACRPM